MNEEAMRLDKWLWAARFFKTRSMAAQAIEKGHVRVAGQRAKASRQIACGAVLQIQQGSDARTVTVLLLSAQRGAAAVAQQLYAESEESVRLRAQHAAARKLESLARPVADHRPDKRERRQLLAWLQADP